MSRFERWSRLKRGELPASAETPRPPRGEAAEGETAEEAGTPGGDAGETAQADRDRNGAPAPGSLDHTLPDPDTLPAGSDIKAYLASGVSSGLRRRALRRLFAGTHYGLRDGLDDYDDDFREKLKPLAGDVAERLRGWTRRHLEQPAPADEVASQDMAGAEQDASAPPSDAPEAATNTDTADTDEALPPGPHEERRG